MIFQENIRKCLKLKKHARDYACCFKKQETEGKRHHIVTFEWKHRKMYII